MAVMLGADASGDSTSWVFLLGWLLFTLVLWLQICIGFKWPSLTTFSPEALLFLVCSFAEQEILQEDMYAFSAEHLVLFYSHDI